MVSFSCENCGDVLTKKKLDSHRGQCRGATFTCLDCHTHFRGTDYKSHTSCISEAQKYQGNLYKEKPSKQSRKSVHIQQSTTPVPRKAYVEDAPEYETNTHDTIAIVDAPPPAPSPPSSGAPRPAPAVNVFDFLIAEDTPNGSIVSLGGSHEQMRMVEHAPPVFEADMQSPAGPDSDEDIREDELHEYDRAFEENGYSYGTEPISTVQNPEFKTPMPKGFANGSRESIYELDGTERKSTDKKRKRNHVEELDLTAARRLSQETDEIMADAPPVVLHSGLTGGLNRLLSKSKFPPSPDYSGNEPSPLSPVKRTKQIVLKDRGRKASSAFVKIRKVSVSNSSRRASDQSRPRKHHRSHHEHPHEDTRNSSRPRRKIKAIEYKTSRPPTIREDSGQQLVLYRSRAELFMSFVTKGPESDSGCSINKALKRYHRERYELGLGLGKVEEEKELWKSLRLRRNERGEVVLLF